MAHEKLGEILQRKGIINEEQLARSLLEQEKESPRRRIGEILIEQKLLDEEQLLEALSEQYKIPYVKKIDRLDNDSQLMSRLPIEFARKHQFCPCYTSNNELVVAMTDPLKVHMLDDLRQLLGMKIRAVLTSSSEVDLAINECYGTQKDLTSQVIKDLEEADYSISLEDLEGAEDLLDMANKAPVIRFVNSIIYHAVNDRASDIHMEPYEKDIRIRYRIDGVLYDTPSPPKAVQRAIASRIKILAGLDIAETRLPQDGRLKISLGDRIVDLRISVLPTSFGERIVMRLLDTGTALLDINHLGFPPGILRGFQAGYTRPNGILLVTGPTGSGKSTTLYSVLKDIQSREKNIITIEDPVEIQIEGISQIQVKPKIEFTFAAGLRSILRQDPDIVMVGEIRDRETAEIAIQGSQTGHLVFSTLHTNDTAGAITRMLDMGIEPYLIGSSLIAVLAQRLVRINCENCKDVYQPDALALETIGCDSDGPFYEGKGCMRCNHIGFKGRKGIFEFLVIDEKVQDMIGHRKSSADIRRDFFEKRKEGVLLREDGIRCILQGLTTVAEVLRVA